jgi:hypothetical protein
MPSSKLATLFFALAAGHLLYIAYGMFQFYAGTDNSDARFLYGQYRLPDVFFMLVYPAFSLLAGFLAQTVTDVRDMLVDQLARQEFEAGASMSERTEA